MNNHNSGAGAPACGLVWNTSSGPFANRHNPEASLTSSAGVTASEESGSLNEIPEQRELAPSREASTDARNPPIDSTDPLTTDEFTGIDSPPIDLSNGWYQYIDPKTRRPYYYNATLNVTTWDRPLMEKRVTFLALQNPRARVGKKPYLRTIGGEGGVLDTLRKSGHPDALERARRVTDRTLAWFIDYRAERLRLNHGTMRPVDDAGLTAICKMLSIDAAFTEDAKLKILGNKGSAGIAQMGLKEWWKLGDAMYKVTNRYVHGGERNNLMNTKYKQDQEMEPCEFSIGSHVQMGRKGILKKKKDSSKIYSEGTPFLKQLLKKQVAALKKIPTLPDGSFELNVMKKVTNELSRKSLGKAKAIGIGLMHHLAIETHNSTGLITSQPTSVTQLAETQQTLTARNRLIRLLRNRLSRRSRYSSQNNGSGNANRDP
eukprot:scaffold4278_cov173-Amphora_coffeaeformis.AAC.16